MSEKEHNFKRRTSENMGTKYTRNILMMGKQIALMAFLIFMLEVIVTCQHPLNQPDTIACNALSYKTSKKRRDMDRSR